MFQVQYSISPCLSVWASTNSFKMFHFIHHLIASFVMLAVSCWAGSAQWAYQTFYTENSCLLQRETRLMKVVGVRETLAWWAVNAGTKESKDVKGCAEPNGNAARGDTIYSYHYKTAISPRLKILINATQNHIMWRESQQCSHPNWR